MGFKNVSPEEYIKMIHALEKNETITNFNIRIVAPFFRANKFLRKNKVCWAVLLKLQL